MDRGARLNLNKLASSELCDPDEQEIATVKSGKDVLHVPAVKRLKAPVNGGHWHAWQNAIGHSYDRSRRSTSSDQFSNSSIRVAISAGVSKRSC